MPRYQTNVAALLEEVMNNSGVGEITNLIYTKVAEAVGVSTPTLYEWFNASVGSSKYLENYKADTERKFRKFFEEKLGRSVQVVIDLDPRIQEAATALATQPAA
ncbi:MAG: hypothetical protein M5R40_24320 [Anaerolineae bacterium]|nr:hypothetical protein [Anaerolineae bacterium]